MGPVAQEKKSWKEINKARKEERKKWKENNTIKKIEKEKLKLASTAEETVEPVLNSENISTLSIAVPGSILENAQSPELRTYLAGQIARAACIFQADEIVVYDDYGDEANARKESIEDSEGVKTVRRCCVQLGRILQYLECPQYLRKHFFPIHKDLKFAGILNPLDAPHHLRTYNTFEFREGVVSNKPVKPGRGSLINIGLLQDAHADKHLTPGIRCTVKLKATEDSKKMRCTVVSPSMPRQETGVYWGYSVRLANSLSQVFTQSPYKEGYDLTIGTSDKGEPVQKFECPKYSHVLIIFGGLHGLEAALENDDKLKVDDPSLLFDQYLNVLPAQGSRTIRTEEAILITLSAISAKLNPKHKPPNFEQHEAIAQSSSLPQASNTFEKMNNGGNRKVVSKENSADEIGGSSSELVDVDMSRFD